MRDKADYISVLVVSARSSVRRGIVGALFGEDDIKVLGQASNRLELLEGIWKLRPSIVIVDDDDRDISSLETITLINQKSADTKILLLMKDYDEYKELEALRMGVRGFLPRSAGRADFIKCIRALDKGEMWVRRKVMEKLIQQLLVLHTPEARGYPNLSVPSFTEEELEVMMLVGRGCSNKEIGGSLNVSEKAVKHCLSEISKKLNLRNRTDIKRYLKLAV